MVFKEEGDLSLIVTTRPRAGREQTLTPDNIIRIMFSFLLVFRCDMVSQV